MIDRSESYSFRNYQFFQAFNAPCFLLLRSMEMAGPRATCSTTVGEAALVVVVVALMIVSRLNTTLPPPHREINYDVHDLPRSYLILPPPRVRTTQVSPFVVPTPLLVEQHVILQIFDILEANLGTSGMNELINVIYNNVQQQINEGKVPSNKGKPPPRSTLIKFSSRSHIREKFPQHSEGVRGE